MQRHAFESALHGPLTIIRCAQGIRNDVAGILHGPVLLLRHLRRV